MQSPNTRSGPDVVSRALPEGTFERSIFDNQLIQLSDKGGASRLIGAAWADVVAEATQSWLGKPIPSDLPRLATAIVRSIYRLDTIPGVAARASRVGLKNPDFIVLAEIDQRPIVLGVDAKFSVETAKSAQVSAETMKRLFESDDRLTSLLPATDPTASYVDGFFVSPDYSLTHAMFDRRVGHRRVSVSPHDVVLAGSDSGQMFRGVANDDVVERLIGIDKLGIPVWKSLLATQYYLRVERAVAGLVMEERRPLLGEDVEAVSDELIVARVLERAEGHDSAWQMVLSWDQDVESLRRQRQALHQVIGTPLSGAELREMSDAIMVELGLVRRPSRNRVRKALGRRFTNDVREKVGVIRPPIDDFSSELQRVAQLSHGVSERYSRDIRAILEDIIQRLAASDQQ